MRGGREILYICFYLQKQDPEICFLFLESEIWQMKACLSVQKHIWEKLILDSQGWTQGQSMSIDINGKH